MPNCRHRDPEQIARRVEQRMSELESVRHGFLATDIEAHVADDHLLVLLHYDLTPGEQELVDRGAPGAVLELRYDLQLAMEEELVGLVEHETARPVRAFLSANHLDPNIGAETFLLAADDGPPPAAG